MVLLLTDVLHTDPQLTARTLESELYGVRVDRCVRLARGAVVIDLTLDPFPELAQAGYPVERCRVAISPGGSVRAYPKGPPRRWNHRQPSPLARHPQFRDFAADLCLFYPRDPLGLRWTWADGLEQYVTRLHRHLAFEEAWRQTGQWPVEDAPHGDAADGSAHPITSAFMRKESRRWSPR